MYATARFFAAAALGATGATAFGGQISMLLSYVYEDGNGTLPDPGTGPGGAWGRATLTDVVAGHVSLTLDATFDTGSGRSEFIRDWYFNFTPDTDVSGLTFGSLPNAGWSVSTGTDAFQANGDGTFDILFNLPTSSSQRLDHNESVTIDIFGTGITVQSFNLFSESGKGGQPYGFRHVGHIAGVPVSGGGTNSVHATENLIPLPTSAAMATVGLLAVSGLRRRR